ncbi:MAG: dTDP-4-dehydrorhamnose 3,5-epimerase [Oligoflexia bacterium]|nr:dTDP-4-dehydrorhamnose 3,5-epimerase [Oligoflexia bacterium]
MKVTSLGLPGLLLVETRVFGDKRGFFMERFNQEEFSRLGLPDTFVQDNHSRSAPGIVRGLHFQTDPAQGKLVGVVRGAIWDVAVDLREDSPTFGQHATMELTGESGRFFWIPAGFAHGFCVLGDEPADLLYKTTALYNPKTEGGIHWADPELGIPWPLRSPVLSARDEGLQSFAEYRKRPAVWKT